jgi:hypothetical protein
MSRNPQWLTKLALIALTLAFGFGCASSKVTSIVPATNEEIPRPGVLLVYNFAVGPNDVVVDTLGSEFQSAGTKLTKQEETAYATANALSQLIVTKLRERGIRSERAAPDHVPPMNALILKGQFLTVNKGSRAKRMIIGFGVGSSKLQVRVQAYQATPHGLHRIAEAEVDSHGSKMPGMALPVAGGAIAGTAATSAIISGGMNIMKETRGAMHDDASRIADDIAERAEGFYQRQGWL